MKDKTILGAWCSEPNCIFIDNKHIETKVMVHIWYSYDNDNKTDIMNKKISFVKEIDFDECNNIVEIPNELDINLAFIDNEYLLDKEHIEKKIPEKLEMLPDNEHYSNKVLYGKINEIIDYLKSKGDE